MSGGRRSQASKSPPPTFSRRAHPLPSKQAGWQPLHLIFRPSKLPRLPEIHRPDILAVFSSPIYDKAVPPTKHSIKTLAWMGDAALLLAATKAVLLGPFEDKTNPCLSAIRSGLTNNRTFSYLTASYRIVDHFAPSHSSAGQKRYADFFESYIGAAWIQAKETGDADDIRDLEHYLSKLFEPNVWPALEDLMNGSDGVVGTIRLGQDLESGSDGEADISVFNVPPTQRNHIKHRSMVKKKQKKQMKKNFIQIKAAQKQQSPRQHVSRTGLRARPTASPGTSRVVGTSTRPIVLDD